MHDLCSSFVLPPGIFKIAFFIFFLLSFINQSIWNFVRENFQKLVNHKREKIMMSMAGKVINLFFTNRTGVKITGILD